MSAHIEKFACRLRELKERSGRSYGMLATRLHVSTSTLHRYCNGAAVPAEYAPVERFARQCGATAEELVALHQLWLLADAARRQGVGGRAPEPAGPESSVAAARTVRPSAAGTAAGPDAHSEHPAAPAPAASASTPFAEVPLPTRPSPPDPSAPDSRSDPVDAPGEAAPHRRLRRTVVLGAAALAVAVAVPLALRGTLFTAADPSARPPASPGAEPVGSGKPPVQVTVLADNWDSQCGQWFLLRQRPDQVPPPPSLQQTNAWGKALGGLPAQDLRLQLTAQARPGEPVVLHALYVKVLSSAPAPKGNAYTPADGCGGGIDPASFHVDLDASLPRAHAVTGAVGDGTTSKLVDLPLQVSATEAQVLDVDAHTQNHDVNWYLNLVWSCGTRQGTLRIDDHGTPFRTVGLKGDRRYSYTGSAWES
jgi:Helix-turn-helix domain